MDIQKELLLWVGAALVCAMVVSFIMCPLVKSFAYKIGAIDVPKDSRRMHKKPVPRLGGLAIFLGFMVSILLFVHIDHQMKGILLGAVIILSLIHIYQVCVIGAEMAKQFFGTVDPVGKTLKVNGNNFTVVGVYAARGDEGDNSMKQMDNMVVFPYTASRVLGGARFTEYIVKARDSESANTAIAYIGGFLKGLVPQGSGDYEVRAADYWQQYQNESFNMIGMVLGGIAAISLLSLIHI